MNKTTFVIAVRGLGILNNCTDLAANHPNFAKTVL